MTEVRQYKRALEGVRKAVAALDADLAAGRITAEEHARQRAEREREAGRLFFSLRDAQRAAREQEPPEPAAPPAGVAWTRNPWTLGIAGLLLLAVSVGAGAALAQRWSAPRPTVPIAAVPPPATATAPDPAGPMGEVAQRALEQAATRDDASTDTLLQYAHVLLDQGKLDDAQKVYDRVLAREPKNVEAITHVGAILQQRGRVDEALAKVDEALRLDPTYVHALWDRTQYLYYTKKDYPGAVRAAQAFLKVVPDGQDAASVKKILDDAQKRAGPPGSPKGQK